jgi:hypothetical protein
LRDWYCEWTSPRTSLNHFTFKCRTFSGWFTKLTTGWLIQKPF